MSQRWLKKLGATFMVALVVGSIVCAVYAQKSDQSDDPATDIVTSEPTTEAPPTDTPTTEAPPQPTAIPTTDVPPAPTSIPTTEAPPQPTAIPTTEAPPPTAIPTTEAPPQPTEILTATPVEITVTDAPPTEVTTDTAPTDVLSTATLASSATVEIPAGDTTSAPTLAATVMDTPVATLPLTPSGSDLPTPAPTTLPPTLPVETETPAAPQPDPASISLRADRTRLAVGDTITFTLSGEGLDDVAIVSALCEVDPARLSGQSATAGDLLAKAALTDSGFLPSGQWVLRAQADQLSGSGSLWRLTYQASAEGQALIACRVQLIDRDGQALPLTTSAVAQAIDVVPGAAMPTSTASDMTEIVATETETPAEAPTEAPQATPEATDALNADVPELTLEAPTDMPQATPEATDVLNADGPELTLEAPTDTPEATAEATEISPQATPEATDVLNVDAPELTLEPISGDVDGNGLVNRQDADIVLRYFGEQAPPDQPSVDVNGDGVIDIFDLALVGAGIRADV